MLFHIALSTLLSERGKLLAALVGVIFSVILVNVQSGLFFGLVEKAGLLVDQSNADIWIGRHGMHNVDLAHDIPARWLHRVRGVAGVAEAEPMRIVFSEMTLRDGSYEGVVVIGINPHSDLGQAWEVVQGPEGALALDDGVIVDECDDERLDNPKLGETREIGGKRARIVGKSRGVLSFLVTPYVFTTFERAAEYGRMDSTKVSYFLVRLEPGASVEAVCAEIHNRLPDLVAYPAQKYAATSVNFWITRTGLGMSFGAAACLGLFIGLVMVGQALYASVLSRLREFATLKALGATETEIVQLLAIQASCLAGLGISIGTVLTIALTELLSTPRVAINIPPWLYAGSAVLVLLICLLAAALPYLQVRRVDPHTALQG